MNRRDFVSKVIPAIYAGGVCTGLCSGLARAQWPTGKGSDSGARAQSSPWPDASSSSGSSGGASSQSGFNLRSQYGCSLLAGAGQAAQNQLQLSTTCGDRGVDKLSYDEVNVLTRYFGLSPAFVFFDDSQAPNALATPEQINPQYDDGSVLLGITLLRHIRGKGPYADAAQVAIMAHEWGHIMQFSQNLFVGGRNQELHADILSGWYLGAKYRWFEDRGMRADARGAAQQLYEVGDRNFNDPNHHGTPEQRVTAGTIGFDMGYQRLSSHDAFEQGWERLNG